MWISPCLRLTAVVVIGRVACTAVEPLGTDKIFKSFCTNHLETWRAPLEITGRLHRRGTFPPYTGGGHDCTSTAWQSHAVYVFVELRNWPFMTHKARKRGVSKVIIPNGVVYLNKRELSNTL